MKLSGIPLADVLLSPIPDCSRTRRYQHKLDDVLAEYQKGWDVDRGLLDSRGLTLPHETHSDYWSLPAAKQEELNTPETRAAYEANAGRAGTAVLCVAAFCYQSPLSRFHHNPELLTFFTNGLRFHIGSIRDDGQMGTFGLNGQSWAHGWDVEGLIYGMVFLRDALPDDLVELAELRFRRAAHYLKNLQQVPSIIGSYGNQRVVYSLGLHLYGQVLDDPDLLAFSDRLFSEAMPKILDASGQVIEQQGPCLHYSYTAVIYVWLNFAVRNDRSEMSRLSDCLKWFRNRHTDSFYPFAGPSARQYKERLNPTLSDLLPIAEQVACNDPSALNWVLAAIDSLLEEDAECAEAERPMPVAVFHGAGNLMWAMLMSPGETTTTATQRAAWDSSDIYCYDSTHLLKRAVLRYITVRQRYQCHYNYTDFLPFAGLQTWAWGDEEPILHPTLLAPSTTRAYGIDTARQGTSHNWGLYGAGAVGINGYLHFGEASDDIAILVSRHDWLWRVVAFTPCSTVVVEFGKGGDRESLWTLNRNAPRELKTTPGKVAFAGSAACLYTTLPTIPTTITPSDEHPELTDVKQLHFDCGNGPVAFALSDDSFAFETEVIEDQKVRFSDRDGQYELTLHDGFFLASNPGNVGVDTWQLAFHSSAKRLSSPLGARAMRGAVEVAT